LHHFKMFVRELELGPAGFGGLRMTIDSPCPREEEERQLRAAILQRLLAYPTDPAVRLDLMTIGPDWVRTGELRPVSRAATY
jgi:hypothetical protein